MPHRAEAPRVLRPKLRNALSGLSLRPRATTVENKPVLRQGRRKTLNPAGKASLNIHERPVRKKKKTPKYETYERDRGIAPTPVEVVHATETNVLLALGLRPTANGVPIMHVVDGEGEKPKLPVAAEPPSKSVAVSVVTTTVDDVSPATENDIKIPISPKVNGVCDSAGEVVRKSNSRRNSKETVSEAKKERQSPPAQQAQAIKVDASEPQDLTVTCTSSVDAMPKTFPSAKYISISVEQCQGSQQESPTMPSRKRSAKSSDSDDSHNKRGKIDEREATVAAFVEQASSGTVDDLQRHIDATQQEIHGLNALARTKEHEWNDIIRARKLKEEMYLRLARKKQIMMLMMGSGSRPPDDTTWDFNYDRLSDFVTNNDEVPMNRVRPRLPSNLTITKSQSGASQQLQRFLLHPQRQEQQANGARHRSSKSSRANPFPILPKPVDNGRQGQIVDVKSIIAGYRQAHPETIPRRGRRMRGTAENLVSSSRNVLNMSSIALGSGSQVRTVGSTSGPEETSRPSSADSSRSDALTLKDAYVQYSKMNNSSSGKAPPPYPEITLHPVLPGNSQSSSPPTSSLLHGILTKQAVVAPTTSGATTTTGQKSTAFSPTLARLLTTPDQPSTTTITTALRGAGTSASSSSANVSISELLSTSKTRNELTITPVVHAQPAKTKEDVVSGSHDEDGDDQDRLVIDEGEEDTENDPPDTPPECQGCHQRVAQFVCAGCGNQWYCSRTCQVNAWDEHSEVCVG